MVRVIKLVLVLLVAVGVAGAAVSAFSQSEAQQPAVTFVSGEVVSVDLLKSTVVIRQIKDQVAGTYENQAISVLAETKVTKDGAALKLSDLKAGDNVSVKYAADALGAQKVESISVEVKK
jgi:hypothetical protein